jgi:serine/threonine-protein kinase
MPLHVGETINGRYRIIAPISQGRFGAVYRAWDENLDQTVALKENLHVSPEAQRQFRREATLLANLRHPNLPRVIDHFIIPERGQYLIMDFIEGRSLAELLRANGRPFSEAEVLPWIRQVCSALAYLHGRQPPIIHRDIKPENIIITPESQATLVDFGISKVLAEELTTTVGARGITPGYSPPEQYGGTTDARSDIYALGATLYTLLAGRKPTDSVLLVAGDEPLTPPRVINGALKPATEDTILKAMKLDRSKRFTDVNSLLAALEREEAVGDVTVLDAPPHKPPLPMPAPVVQKRTPVNRKPAPSSQPAASPKRSWLRPLALIGGIIGLIAVTFWGWQLMADNNNLVEATATAESTLPAVVELTTQTALPEASSTSPHPSPIATRRPTALLPTSTVTLPTTETAVSLACVEEGTQLFVWDDQQISAGNCTQIVQREDFVLQPNQQVQILGEEVRSVPGPESSCQINEFIRIQSVDNPEVEGWVLENGLRRISPEESCGP